MNPTAAPALMGGPAAATTRGELAAALSAAGLGVHSRPSLPVMGGVLVEADAHGDVHLTGCQYECAVTVALPGAAQAPGRMVVDHSEAVRVLKALVKGKGCVADATPIMLAVESSTAVMRADGCTVPLTTYDVDEYPPLPDTPRGSRVTVDRELIASELCRVKCARGTDTEVPATMGFHLAGTPDGVELAATDRYRLAVARIPVVDTEGPNIEALLPGPFLEHLIKHLTGPTVTIGLEANIASITSGDVTALVGLSGLDLPNYHRLLHLPGAQAVVVPRKGLIAAVERAAAICAAKKERYRHLALSIEPSSCAVTPVLDGAVRVTAPPVPVRMAGKLATPFELQFRADFLRDALSSFHGEHVALHITSPVKPVLFTDEDGAPGEHLAYQHLLMPVRTD
ncbi:DNA polymerase III subunit beta [Nocardiopsis suaedae]|uniref:DNA polymerase III subunit beta n=1 Tax=Nocardiopsis suaedae TaxID=3018444 RepID=A0ABT4TR51_9ACTN|nr:DNA polymerase III subunit beta [Nocardiopsis suaedae]MDA2807176.1 DNA polymerase III subunit beta [Nocardiopsis suaedae]